MRGAQGADHVGGAAGPAHWHGKNEGDAYYDQYCPDYANRFRSTVAQDYVVARTAAERGIGTVDASGGRSLSVEQKAAILRELGAKLVENNASSCTSGCSTQAVQDEALVHQKKTGLVQIRAKPAAA